MYQCISGANPNIYAHKCTPRHAWKLVYNYQQSAIIIEFMSQQVIPCFYYYLVKGMSVYKANYSFTRAKKKYIMSIFSGWLHITWILLLVLLVIGIDGCSLLIPTTMVSPQLLIYCWRSLTQIVQVMTWSVMSLLVTTP